jgi:hypothetical protein
MTEPQLIASGIFFRTMPFSLFAKREEKHESSSISTVNQWLDKARKTRDGAPLSLETRDGVGARTVANIFSNDPPKFLPGELVPSFGHTIPERWKSAKLIKDEGEKSKQVLCALASNFPLLSFCPMLVPLVEHFGSRYSMDKTYTLVATLLERSLKDHDFYFPTSADSFHRHCQTFEKLVRANYPTMSATLTEKGVDVKFLYGLLLQNAFLRPFHESSLDDILPAFFLEGGLVHMRLALVACSYFSEFILGQDLEIDELLANFNSLLQVCCLDRSSLYLTSVLISS